MKEFMQKIEELKKKIQEGNEFFDSLIQTIEEAQSISKSGDPLELVVLQTEKTIGIAIIEAFLRAGVDEVKAGQNTDAIVNKLFG